jgi:hypothetical protein
MRRLFDTERPKGGATAAIIVIEKYREKDVQ